MTDDRRGIAARIAAAEPAEPRALADLVARLDADDHRTDAATSVPLASIAGTLVRGVTFDSRLVGPGSLFVAIPGARADGHDFVATAARAGAAAALVERVVDDAAIPQVVVDATRPALASAAAWWYGDPSAELAVVGITGTDGKTTTSFLAVAALDAAGVSSGLMGTVETKIGPDREANPAHATTPEAPLLQAALRAMVQAGDRAAVIETTSHGLALHRVDRIAYDVAILTNLSHEHLEFHGTFEAYRAAKVSLFERLGTVPAEAPKAARPWPRTAIVNMDDPNAAWFTGAAHRGGARVIGYGAADKSDVRLGRVEDLPAGVLVAYDAPSGPASVSLRLSGRFNAYNALAVVALGEAMDLDPAAVRAGLASLERVPGRMERIVVGQPFEVIVDFAHSPASLEAVLDELGPAAAARGGGLIAVFGSAGERDVAKRPLMGRIAGERCRLVVVTDEDPRGEDRMAILDEIAAGAEAAGRVRGEDLLLIADREEAIAAAFAAARRGDSVLLAGKGHEPSIIGPTGPRPWDEAAEARRALAALGHEG